MCELTGSNSTWVILEAHHIYGKSTPALRYDLRNGICLTSSLHEFKVHSSDPRVSTNYQQKIENRLKILYGSDIVEELKLLKNNPYADLRKIKQHLLEELKK